MLRSLGTYAILMAWACVSAVTAPTSAGEPKVGSPEWKREFQRQQAEFQREFEAKRAAMEQRRSQIRRTSSHPATAYAPQFNANTAPSPGDCLKSFRKATRNARSFEQLLPYVSARQRENYRLSKSRGSDFDKLGFYRELLGRIIRIDDVHIDNRPGKGDLAYIDVIRETGGDFGYSSGRFTMRGEGNRWRVEAYKSSFASNYIPDAPEIDPDEYQREGLGYLEVQERRRERLREEFDAESEPVVHPVSEGDASDPTVKQ